MAMSDRRRPRALNARRTTRTPCPVGSTEARVGHEPLVVLARREDNPLSDAYARGIARGMREAGF